MVVSFLQSIMPIKIIKRRTKHRLLIFYYWFCWYCRCVLLLLMMMTMMMMILLFLLCLKKCAVLLTFLLFRTLIIFSLKLWITSLLSIQNHWSGYVCFFLKHSSSWSVSHSSIHILFCIWIFCFLYLNVIWLLRHTLH
jgi:hypothetical protein